MKSLISVTNHINFIWERFLIPISAPIRMNITLKTVKVTISAAKHENITLHNSSMTSEIRQTSHINFLTVTVKVTISARYPMLKTVYVTNSPRNL